MSIIFRHVVGDAGNPRVDLGTAQVLCTDHLAGCRLNQRRPAQKDGALALDDNAFVGHRRDIGTARRAASHDDSNLWNAL